VCLVYLVCIVCLVCLVCIVCIVCIDEMRLDGIVLTPHVKYFSFGQKYLCRAYNVGRVVELNISVSVKNISVEPTMLVVL
jgi:hypothetical protein